MIKIAIIIGCRELRTRRASLPVQGKAEKTVLCDSLRELESAAGLPNVNQAYAPDGTKRYKKGNSTVRHGFNSL